MALKHLFFGTCLVVSSFNCTRAALVIRLVLKRWGNYHDRAVRVIVMLED